MRNMVLANRDAFANLIEQFSLRNDNIVPDGRRFIRTSEVEKGWLKELELLDRLDMTPSLRMQMITFQEEKFVVVVGAQIDSSKLDPTVLSEIDINAGLFTALLSENIVRLDRNISALQFFNSILFQHLEDGYVGHDIHELIEFLEHISVFSVPIDSIFQHEILARSACYIFSADNQFLVLDYSPDVLHLTSDISLVGPDSLSYKILLSYLFSTTYKHAFLELYRLVERLFPIGFLKDLYDNLHTHVSFLEFAASIEDEMSWKPREDQALEKLFGSCNAGTIQCFDLFMATSVLLQGQNIHKFFYSLRNSIVHFRANHQEQTLTRGQWNLLLVAMLYLIDEKYSLHNSILNIPENVDG